MIEVNYNEYKETIAQNMKLIIENHELKEKINKAIEFIYENAYNEERNYQIDDLWYEIPKLLDILKGESND